MKGWPQRVPSLEEAARIADIRGRILQMHGLETPYITARQVRDRIALLYDCRRAEEAMAA